MRVVESQCSESMEDISVNQRRASRSHVRCDDARQCVLLEKIVHIIETMTCVVHRRASSMMRVENSTSHNDARRGVTLLCDDARQKVRE
jgi:hypothetical protein